MMELTIVVTMQMREVVVSLVLLSIGKLNYILVLVTHTCTYIRITYFGSKHTIAAIKVEMLIVTEWDLTSGAKY